MSNHLQAPSTSFIDIAGMEGVGKTLQADKLAERITNMGIKVLSLSFPQIQNPNMGPYELADKIASAHLKSQPKIERALSARKLVLTDGFVLSTFVSQSIKLDKGTKPIAMLKWLEDYEFKRQSMPQPTKSVVLLEHLGENAPEHAKNAYAAYRQLAQERPDQISLIYCTNEQKRQDRHSAESVHGMIWDVVEPLLGRMALVNSTSGA